jgi:O-acetylhomoserine/O-acetylserine sulfhydrylase
LEKHPLVSWVSYLGLRSHSSHQLALTYLRKGAFGGVLCFGVKGDLKDASMVVDNLRLASNLANVGAYLRITPSQAFPPPLVTRQRWKY